MKVVLAEKYKQEKEQFWTYADKFIASKPKIAREINEKLIPEHEKQALEYVKRFKAYSYNLKELRSDEKREFAKLTKEIVSSKEIINHLSNKEPELALKIKQTFKEQEHTLKYKRSISFGRGF